MLALYVGYSRLLVFLVRNNLVDKIIYMLEEHSLNLEKLVEKRTEQWIEEKKRTEELLHSMLPKYVCCLHTRKIGGGSHGGLMFRFEPWPRCYVVFLGQKQDILLS